MEGKKYSIITIGREYCAGGLMLIMPSLVTDIAGIAVVAMCVAFQYLVKEAKVA